MASPFQRVRVSWQTVIEHVGETWGKLGANLGHFQRIRAHHSTRDRGLTKRLSLCGGDLQPAIMGKVTNSKLALPTRIRRKIKGLQRSVASLFCFVREKYGKRLWTLEDDLGFTVTIGSGYPSHTFPQKSCAPARSSPQYKVRGVS
jgi:hypothetical protein